MKLINYIGNFIFTLLLLIGIFFFFNIGLYRTYNNLLNSKNIKKGIITSSEILTFETFNGSDITNRSVIKIDDETLIIESENYFEAKKGDTVKLRYVGTKENNIIFEVNGKVIGSMYDSFDYASPFITLLSGFLIYWLYLARFIDFIKRKYFKVFGILLLFNPLCHAQKVDVFCSTSPYLSSEVTNFKVHKYIPIFKAKRTYKSLKEVKNLYPESLMLSEMSVTSQEWSSFNYGVRREAEPARYAKILKADTSKNYANLLYKVSYQLAGIEYAIVKFHIYSDSKPEPIGFALGMKKSGERWVICDDAALTDLLFTLIFFNTDALDEIFQKGQSSNPILNANLKEATVNGKIDLNKLTSIFKVKMAENTQKLNSVLDPYRIFK